MNMVDIPYVDGECSTCGNPTLIRNVVLDDRLLIPGVPVGAVVCCLEGCPAMYRPIGP